VPYDIK